MNSDAKAARKPGRRAENPLQRMQRMQRDIGPAREAAKAWDRDTLAMLARAIVSEARANGELMARLRQIAEQRISDAAFKSRVVELLGREKASDTEGTL